MYKSKLQELCHKRRWGLPKYSAMQDGLDHKASFKASVVVNGETFNSPAAFTSSKQAQNQAAMLAFLTFSSAPSGSSSSTPTIQYDSKEEVGAAKSEESPIPTTHSSVVIDDTNHLCKGQLQNYALRNNLDLPIYTIKTDDGPPHDTHFKATVVIDGKSFESPTFFKTIKEAEQAAAKIALMSLSIDMFQKDESSPYKSLLLELTQKKGFCKPTYKTTQLDSSHMPTFFSTVKVMGEEFHGKAFRSKKQAEHDAARIAYIALKECGLELYAAISSAFKKNKVVQSTHVSDIEKSKQNLNHEVELLDMELNGVKVNNEVYKQSFPHTSEENLIMCKGSSPSTSKSFPISESDISCLPDFESNKTKTSKTSTYMLCNDGFKVYTSFPNIVFSEEITLLPIGDNKWLAVNLVFPNDKDL